MTVLMRQKGFTLIELLVAVAILGIIMAIAIPSYQKHVVRSNWVEAKTILVQTAQALERCYTRYNAYNDSDCNVTFPIESESGWYKMTKGEQTINATSFDLVAEPQKSQATRDTDCKNFTLSHNGTRGVSGSAAVEDCW